MSGKSVQRILFWLAIVFVVLSIAMPALSVAIGLTDFTAGRIVSSTALTLCAGNLGYALGRESGAREVKEIIGSKEFQDFVVARISEAIRQHAAQRDVD